MRHILIATHGLLASGARSTMQFLIGNVDNVDYITAYVDGQKPINEQIEEYFAKIPQGDEVVIFTDIKGGSVHTALSKLAVLDNVMVFSGMNMGLVLDAVMKGLNGKLELAEANDLIEVAKDGMTVMNGMTSEDDEDF